MATRYAELARTLAARIRQGDYPVGSLLPTEPALAEAMGVSRSTVRAALLELQQLGLVTRRRSLGTRVEADRPAAGASGYAQTVGSIDALVQYGTMTRRTILDMSDIVADADLARRIGATAGSRWLCVTHLRIDPDAPERPPICWTRVYVAAVHAPGVRERLATHDGIISQLVEEVAGRRIQTVDQSISAAGVPAEAAGALEAQAGDHALVITRRYLLSANTLAEASISIHPADRFTYTTHLRHAR